MLRPYTCVSLLLRLRGGDEEPNRGGTFVNLSVCNAKVSGSPRLPNATTYPGGTFAAGNDQ